MEDPRTNYDEPLEQWLRQALPSDKPSSHLRAKLHRIPDQFLQNNFSKSYQYKNSERTKRWLFPALATAASVMGIIVGSLDLLGGVPEQNLLATLLYSSPNLLGIPL